MYKTVIIGCGKIAGIYDKDLNAQPYSHAHAYFNNKNIEVACYVNRHIQKARDLAGKYNSNHYSDNYIDTIKACRPDVVSVCTPDTTHFEIIKNIFDAGPIPRVIFVEKPVCSNHDELDHLESFARQNKAQIIVNHTRRFEEKHQNIKRLIATGTFGNLVRGDISYYGGWKHNGVHIVDTLRYLFADEIDVDKISGSLPSRYDNDPTLSLVLFLKSQGAMVHVHAFDEKYYQIFDIDLKFEKARLRIEDFGNKITYEKKRVNSMNENVLVEETLNISTPSTTPVENAVNSIVDYLQAGDHRIIADYSLENSIKTMETLWNVESKYKRKPH